VSDDFPTQVHAPCTVCGKVDWNMTWEGEDRAFCSFMCIWAVAYKAGLDAAMRRASVRAGEQSQ
jgi:hypothetical protein